MNMKSKVTAASIGILSAATLTGHAQENKTTIHQEKTPTVQIKDFEIAIKDGFTIPDNNNEHGKGLSVRKHKSPDGCYFYSFTDSDNNPVTDELATKRAHLKAAQLAAAGDKDMENFEVYVLMGKDHKPVVDKDGQKVKIAPKDVDVKYANATITFEAAKSYMQQRQTR